MASAANRFISCYNGIDEILRDLTGVKPQQSFTEALRVAAGVNAVVRRFEDDLYAYARLRNAIVHSAKGNAVIAEPHEDVVAHIEFILDMLRRPPLVKEILGARTVIAVDAGGPLTDAIMLVAKHRYSNIPVVSHGRLYGLLTPKDIVTALGVKLASEEDLDHWLTRAKVSDVPRSARYVVASYESNVVEVAACFETPKLKAVILTADGTPESRVLDIVTPADLPRLDGPEIVRERASGRAGRKG